MAKANNGTNGNDPKAATAEEFAARKAAGMLAIRKAKIKLEAEEVDVLELEASIAHERIQYAAAVETARKELAALQTAMATLEAANPEFMPTATKVGADGIPELLRAPVATPKAKAAKVKPKAK